MKKIAYILLTLTLLTSCGHNQKPSVNHLDSFECVSSFPLSEYSRLELYRSNDNHVCVLLKDCDDCVDEMYCFANANFCTNNQNEIVLDTVCFCLGEPSYVLKTYDISSTYGAERWFVVRPYHDDNPDGFWTISCLPFERLDVRDVDGDGLTEIISYASQLSDSTTYSFNKGVVTEK